VRALAAILSLFLLSACSLLRRGEQTSNDVTLCVRNSTVMGTLRVWSDVHGRTHNVAGGQTQCRRVGSGGGEVRLYAETIGGGMEGPARGVATLPNRPGECWFWDFRGFGDDNNLVPCDFNREATGTESG
jgi:hypothetical protein